MVEAAWWGLFGASSLVLGALVVMAPAVVEGLGPALGFFAGTVTFFVDGA